MKLSPLSIFPEYSASPAPEGSPTEKAHRRALLRGDLPDSFSHALYRLSPYRGCAHGCRYCDGRAEKYHVEGDFERDILVRDAVPSLLAAELPRLREAGMVAIGSGTTDAYQACEATAQVTAGCARELARHAATAPSGTGRLPVPALVMTKSALALRDLPLWSAVNQAAGFLLLVSISSTDEELREIMEPGASSFAERLALLRAYKQAGCPVGVLAMPCLPGLSDSEASLRRLYAACAEIGVDYLLPGGLTLRPGRQKELYLSTLALHRPELLPLVRELYREERPSGMPLAASLADFSRRLKPIQEEFGLPRQLPHAIHARLLPPWDSFHVLLLDMAELYAERGVSVAPLRQASARYDAWLLGLRRHFRRHRSLPSEWLPERFTSALDSGELAGILDNRRLARLASQVLAEGARFDYLRLKLT